VEIAASEDVETVDTLGLLESEVEIPLSDDPMLWNVEVLVRIAGGGTTIMLRLRVVEVVSVVCCPFDGLDNEASPVLDELGLSVVIWLTLVADVTFGGWETVGVL
jgi:hypothetical protein